MDQRTFIKTIALSETQKDYFIHYLVHPTSAFYHEQFLFRFEQRLDVTVTIRTLTEIVKRHEINRSIFVLEDEPIQKVYSEPILDFEHVASADWDDKTIRAYLNQELGKSFQLDKGPLFSCRLLDYKEMGSILSFKYHHICSDGWSVSLMLDEFTMIYQQLIADQELVIQRTTHHYADFVEWELNYLASQEGEEARAFWKKKLGGPLKRLELPMDKTRPSTPSFKGGISFFTCKHELRDEMIAYRKNHHYQTDVIYLSLFLAFLSRISGQDDIIIGVPRFGRPQKEFYSIMGPCLVMLPLRIKIPKNCSFKELARLVQEELSLCSRYQNYPFSLIAGELDYDRDKKYSSFFSTAFVHQKAIKQDGAYFVGNAQNTFQSNDLTISSYPIHKNISQYDLCFVVEKDNQQDILAGFEYNADILNEETVVKWIADFEAASLFLLKNDSENILMLKSQAKKDYWTKNFVHLPSFKILPEDGSSLSSDSTVFEREKFEITGLLSTQISRLAQSWDSSAFEIFMSTFLVLLHAESEKEDMALAFRADCDQLQKISFLLLRTDLSGNPLFSELVLQVQRKVKEAYQYKDGLESLLHGQPEPQILFEMNEEEPHSTIDFQFRIHESQGQLYGTITYHANVFKRETAQRMLSQYEYVLQSVIAQPHQRIRELVSHLNSQFLSNDDYEQLFL
ncbi:peptide synthetase [Brevibacillus brevis]|uniref:Peptide synthetase n=1 Tax=Brevibacillus brevis TaxID=1393 RepID=A0A2Z4MPH0_BREBE|nr:condensation domain-containing protein [Brevibacillus brevis]AWX58445.1 peptide synthetase [Brevibacillus brevis]